MTNRSKAKGTIPARERMAAKAVVDGDCLRFTGHCGVPGYGQILGDDGKLVSTHRLAYQEYVGPIPEGMFVLHKCDNRWCIKPDHLFVGTHQDNMRDMQAKGRGRGVRGEANKNAKLTDADVAAIRQRYADGETPTSLGREYGIHPNYVHDLVRFKWRRP